VTPGSSLFSSISMSSAASASSDGSIESTTPSYVRLDFLGAKWLLLLLRILIGESLSIVSCSVESESTLCAGGRLENRGTKALVVLFAVLSGVESVLVEVVGEVRFFGNGGTGGISSSSLSSCGGRGRRELPRFRASLGCKEPTDVRADVLVDDIDNPEL
jgi:hypothetical protein